MELDSIKLELYEHSLGVQPVDSVWGTVLALHNAYPTFPPQVMDRVAEGWFADSS